MGHLKFNTDQFLVDPNQEVSLKKYDPAYCSGFKNKKDVEDQLK